MGRWTIRSLALNPKRKWMVTAIGGWMRLPNGPRYVGKLSWLQTYASHPKTTLLLVLRRFALLDMTMQKFLYALFQLPMMLNEEVGTNPSMRILFRKRGHPCGRHPTAFYAHSPPRRKSWPTPSIDENLIGHITVYSTSFIKCKFDPLLLVNYLPRYKAMIKHATIVT